MTSQQRHTLTLQTVHAIADGRACPAIPQYRPNPAATTWRAPFSSEHDAHHAPGKGDAMQTTSTKHSSTCRRAWSHLDATCPRCIELTNGAPARRGWNDHRRRQDEQHRRDIRHHDCTRSQCGPVCTYGEW